MSDKKPSAITDDPQKSGMPSAIQALEKPIDPVATGRQGVPTMPPGALPLKPGMEQLDESGEPVEGLKGITPVEPAASEQSMKTRLAADCVQWCREHEIIPNPLGVIRALHAFGKLD